MGCATSAIKEADQEPQRAYSPASRLYRHALESIFKFCTLKELHALLAVSREWSSAVDSMFPYALVLNSRSLGRLSRIAHSRLSRHVSGIWSNCASSLAGLRLLAERMPWIQHHRFVWLPEHNDCVAAANALSRLRQLKSLQVTLANAARKAEALTIELMDEHAAATNHLIRAAGCMPQLKSLWLGLMCHDKRISLDPLIVLANLRAFRISAAHLPSALPSDDQIAALRAMNSLESFTHDFTDCNGTLRLLLQDPIPPLRWSKALVESGGADLVPLLQSLPDLIELDVQCRCGDVESILSLPRVIKLALWPCGPVIGPADLTRIVTTLQRCTHLTGLRLMGLGVTSAQLGDLLPALPRLSDVKLLCLRELTSLSCLATEALAGSLTDLAVVECSAVPTDETVHLLGLRSLRSLLVAELREALSVEQRATIQRAHPSVALQFFSAPNLLL